MTGTLLGLGTDNLHGSARRKKFFSRISVPRGEDRMLFKEGMKSCPLFSSIRWWNFKNLRLTKSWAEKNWEAVKKPLCSNFIQLGQINQLGQPFPWPSHLFLFLKLFPQILYRRNSLLNWCLLFIPKHQLKEKQESGRAKDICKGTHRLTAGNKLCIQWASVFILQWKDHGYSQTPSQSTSL